MKKIFIMAAVAFALSACGNKDVEFKTVKGDGCTAVDTATGASIECDDGTAVDVEDGKDGSDGKNGVNGVDGTNGADGKDGIAGPQGPRGPKGDVGPQGPRGPKGDSGFNGRDGKDGADGKNSLIDLERAGEIDGCYKGGTYIYSGLDVDGNGSLEDSEITSVSYICDGKTKKIKDDDDDDDDREKCNNGNGNGNEGCSPSDNGNDDE